MKIYSMEESIYEILQCYFKEDYKTYNVDLFDVYIPFRNNPLLINIGSLGLE